MAVVKSLQQASAASRPEFGNPCGSSGFARLAEISGLDLLGFSWNFSSESGLFNGLRGLWRLWRRKVTPKHPPHFAKKMASHRPDCLGRFLFVRDAIRFRSVDDLNQVAAATKKEGGAWELRRKNLRGPPPAIEQATPGDGGTSGQSQDIDVIIIQNQL
jgi:hypothetical protein